MLSVAAGRQLLVVVDQSKKQVRVFAPGELWMGSLFTVTEAVWAFLPHGLLNEASWSAGC